MALCIPLYPESPEPWRVGHTNLVAAPSVVLRCGGSSPHFEYLGLSLCQSLEPEAMPDGEATQERFNAFDVQNLAP